MRFFYPDHYAESVHRIPYRKLWDKGYRLLLFDVDNTLETYITKEPGAEVRRLIAELKEIGFTVILLSNGKEERVKTFSAPIGVSYYYRAGKPMPKGVRLAMRDTGFSEKETIVIGDQIFTDVCCAHAAGARAILTRPISYEIDEWITRPKRPLERLVLRGYFKKRQKNDRHKS
ncbi:MAG: YqeG family HAD IIIA-type phosphatase [Firmicutes bacterium]|nr:YqeG family HAD IIIA-type phosphatase [Bacillota bacterium]